VGAVLDLTLWVLWVLWVLWPCGCWPCGCSCGCALTLWVCFSHFPQP